MTPGDVDKVVAWVMEKVTAILGQIKLIIRKADFGSIMAGIALIVSVVEQASEQFGGLNGPEKKEVAKRVLNNLIDIPYVPETVEGWIFGVLIDWIVDALNLEKTFTGPLDQQTEHLEAQAV